MSSYVRRRAEIFSALDRPRYPLSKHGNTFWDLITPGSEGPQPNVWKFDPDMFPELKTSYDFVCR